MTKRILITGGCGFIGHHFVEHLLKNTDEDSLRATIEWSLNHIAWLGL